MVSRRNFLAITTMMLVVCFLFMIPQYVKDQANPYYENTFVSESAPMTSDTRWEQQEITNVRELRKLSKSDDYLLFVGSRDSEIGYSVSSWAEYTKQLLVVSPELKDYARPNVRAPKMVMVDPEFLDLEKDTERLEELRQKGVTIVFCNTPEPEVLRGNSALMHLLGIEEVIQDEVEMDAVCMYRGFLLGGERTYQIETEKDVQMMDLDLSTPWYMLTPGTKTYLVGFLSEDILPEQEYRNEQLPALLWRVSGNGANVFVVCGDYLTGVTGIGFLSAIMAEDNTYFLYPVVNSQVLTVANFPGLADENQDAVVSLYGRSQNAVIRDLLWPSVMSVSELNGFRMSCFFMPQYDYLDDNEPNTRMLTYFLKQLKEQNAEGCVSLEHSDSVTLAQKWEQDHEVYETPIKYPYNAVFADEASLKELSGNAALLDRFPVVSGKMEDGAPLFSFLDDDTLCQQVTNDVLEYTFTQDLELRCLETALGYSNILLDMRRPVWPEGELDRWEVLYEAASSNLHTFWQRYSMFDRLSVSESDARIRNFLSMDYRQSREGNLIILELSQQQPTDFILRTHMENVTGVTGGSFEKLENGAWKIHCADDRVEIQLEKDAQYYY